MFADEGVIQTVIDYVNRLKTTDAEFGDLRERVGRELGVDLSAVSSGDGIIRRLEPYGRHGWQALLDACQAFPPAVRRQRACEELIELMAKLASLKEQRDSAVDRLYSHLRWQAPASWEEIYLRSVDDLHLAQPQANGDLRKALDSILKATIGGDVELVRFIERLANQMDTAAAAALRTLNTKVAATLEIPDWQVAELQAEVSDDASVRPHVLARIDSDASGKALTVWRYYSSATPVPRTERLRYATRLGICDRPLASYDEVADELLALLTPGMLGRTGQRCQPVLNVMLPWDDLDSEVEGWPVPAVGGDHLGRLMPVVVRPPAEPDSDRRVQRERWNEIHAGASAVGRIATDYAGYAARPWLCAAIVDRTAPGDAVRAARAAGIPAVIWHGDGLDPRDTLNAGNLNELPDLVLASRRNGGGRLAAMWDDPYWVPRGQDLEWQE
jgi:vWA-MoxR associated protein C-terminal domain